MSDAPFDPTAVSGMNLGEIPDIGLDTELNNDSAPFLGVVVIDEWKPNYNKDGWEWHLGVRPIDFVLNGETGCFHANANASTKKNSKMGVMLEAFKTVRGKSQAIKVGKGFLLGYAAVFVRRTLTWDRRDGSSTSAQVLIPVRAATEEEAARAAGAQSVAQQAVPAGGFVAPAASVDLTEAQQAEILKVLDGKTPHEFQLAVITSGLAPDLMSLVLSGKALDLLKAKELVTIDAEGRVRAQAFV